MRQGMLAAFLVAALGFGFGMAQGPDDASAPSLTDPGVSGPALGLDGDELQGGNCGNRACEPPEDCHSCPQDCGDCCGNRHCEPPEDCNSCPQDCC